MSTVQVTYCDWPPTPYCRDCGRWNPDLIAAKVKESLQRQRVQTVGTPSHDQVQAYPAVHRQTP